MLINRRCWRVIFWVGAAFQVSSYGPHLLVRCFPNIDERLPGDSPLLATQGRCKDGKPSDNGKHKGSEIPFRARSSHHPTVAGTLTNRGCCVVVLVHDAVDDPLTALRWRLSLCFQGKYAEAAALYERSQAILEKALGPDHLDVATILDNRAGLLTSQVRAVRHFEQRSYRGIRCMVVDVLCSRTGILLRPDQSY